MNTEKELTREEIIKKHLFPMFGSLEFASIDYFKETGTINGSFSLRLNAMLKDYGRQQFEKGQQESKWIPVEERLPDKKIFVLIGWKDDVTCKICFIDEDGRWRTDKGEIVALYLLPDFWQPLPPSPVTEGKEKEE